MPYMVVIFSFHFSPFLFSTAYFEFTGPPLAWVRGPPLRQAATARSARQICLSTRWTIIHASERADMGCIGPPSVPGSTIRWLLLQLDRPRGLPLLWWFPPMSPTWLPGRFHLIHHVFPVLAENVNFLKISAGMAHPDTDRVLHYRILKHGSWTPTRARAQVLSPSQDLLYSMIYRPYPSGGNWYARLRSSGIRVGPVAPLVLCQSIY
jgi:hypothetical protein